MQSSFYVDQVDINTFSYEGIDIDFNDLQHDDLPSKSFDEVNWKWSYEVEGKNGIKQLNPYFDDQCILLEMH